MMAGINTNVRIADLIAKRYRGILNQDERDELARWLASDARHRAWYARILNESNITGMMAAAGNADMDTAMREINTRIDAHQHKKGAVRPIAGLLISIAAALALLMVVAGGYYVWKYQLDPGLQQQLADAAPGGNRATLRLGDGRTIDLAGAGVGLLAEDGGLRISKTADGRIQYEALPGEAGEDAPIAYNTIEVPVGGQYQVILPDLSCVWINSASSLRYPTRFPLAPGERRVVLSGEAYFEISEDKNRQFVVQSTGAEVRVVGTHFNVDAYQGKTVATLLQGAVTVDKTVGGAGTVTLRPGQQATIADEITVSEVDTGPFVGWKDGMFIFRKTPLRSVVDQLSRWYGVDVDYTGMPDKRFNAEMPRDVMLSEVLHMLEITSDIKLELREGRLQMAN